MSDDIYANKDFIRTPSISTAENIFMTEVPQGSQQRTEHAKTQDNSGGQYRHCILAVVCVLFLAVITSLKIQQYIKIAAEKEQLETKFNAEKDQQQFQYTAEKVQLETKFNVERDQQQFQYTAEKVQLETKFNAERDELQFQYNRITAEKVQLETKFNAERDELQRCICALEPHDMNSIKKHAVDVILDPDTAYPKLILSADGKQVKYGDIRQNLPDTPKRFSQVRIVLGREGFSSGKFYYEVQVKGNRWTIGVAKESINRKGKITLSPRYGLWTIWLKNGTYMAAAGPSVPLSLKGKLQRVGVFVDYDTGLVSFYDADCWNHIYSYTNVSFTEKIYPYFSPGDGNSVPLVISPDHFCPIN